MNVLQISPRIPFPLTEGGSIGIFNITKQLKRHGARIYLIASSPNGGEEIPGEISEICEDVLVVKRAAHYTPLAVLRNLFSNVPINVSKYHSGRPLRLMRRFLEGKKIDLIHVDHLNMAYYGIKLRDFLDVPVVLREHNLELKIMERFSQTSPNPVYRSYAKLQLKKFMKYEPSMCARADKCIMITESDRERLQSYGKRVDAVTIPAGVDTGFFQRVEMRSVEKSAAYIGSLDWRPNIDGLRWFVRNVVPIITKSTPDFRFYIYGKSPAPEVLRLGDDKNVIVRGFVEDARQVFRGARIIVVPLFAASGMRIKILEAMSAGKPVVTTSVGCEGIGVAPGRNILVADVPAEFAGRIISLLGNPAMCDSIGKEARDLVVGRYSWDRIGDMFWKTYNDLLAKSTNSRGID